MPSKKELKTYSSLSTRQGRRKSGLCICEGVKCCMELFRARPDLIEKAFFSGEVPAGESFPGLRFEEISSDDMRRISPTVTPQGVLFVARRPGFVDFPGFDGIPFAILLDRIQDPGNLGTILRTAKAAGLDRILVSDDCADPYSEKVIRAATAMQFSMRISRYGDLDSFSPELISKGCRRIFLAVVSGGSDVFLLDDLFDKSAIVFGNEGRGLRAGLDGVRVSIPMPGGVESLNVAQAATVILFESVRRHLGMGCPS